jgi:UDP-N-acetylglucosamine diphosphorylase/glucosamine-1-phosphate N-acetyltransferase
MKETMLAIVIMAAGKGTRMNSDLPKVLHRIGGRPMIEHVLLTADLLKPDRKIAIVGHRRDEVEAVVQAFGVECVVQDPQLGTAHAVQQAERVLEDFTGDVVILSGDVPLLRTETLRKLRQRHREMQAAGTVLTTQTANPTGYGRIIRDEQGVFQRIVEEKDANSVEKAVKEVNSGIYCFDSKSLFHALKKVKNDNAKGEYYLTDVIGILKTERKYAQAIDIADYKEVQGINTLQELNEAENSLISAPETSAS